MRTLFFIGLLALFGLLSPAFGAGPDFAAEVDESAHKEAIKDVPKEFTDEIDRDFNLRSVGEIQLINLRGNISVQGWAQDKIHVHAHRRVFAANEVQAKAAFAAMGFRFQEGDGGIECSAQYGRGLEIHERIAERGRPIELQSKMDIVVFAPSRSSLKAWTASGTLALKNWNSSAELRTISGDISAELVNGTRVTSLCQNCSAKFRAIKGSVRALSDGGNLAIEDVEGPEIFLETAGGNITAQNVVGEQLYVTKAGNLTAKNPRGHVEFQTQQGAVSLTGLRGFASGKTESGSIQLRADEWDFHDKALIESLRGNISLSFPNHFSAEVDLRSNKGKVECAFPVLQGTDQKSVANRPETGVNHLSGRVGDQTTDLLRVFSDAGDIQILRLNR